MLKSSAVLKTCVAALFAVVLASTACSSSDDPVATDTGAGADPANDGAPEIEVVDGADAGGDGETDGDGTADGASDPSSADAGDQSPSGEAATSDPADQPDPPAGGGTGGSDTHTVVASVTGSSIEARETPDEGAAVVATLDNPLPSGTPLVFRVVPGGSSSSDWVEVMLPIEPNGSTGWVPRSDVSLSDNPYRIEIDRASYSLRVYNLEELWVESTVGIGTGDTPTPVGDFYLLELLQPPDPGGPYGAYAFGLSGFSEVLENFGDADTAIIGLHGTNDPASLGTDVSHGCIRLDNETIEKLATTVPLGTPVLIT